MPTGVIDDNVKIVSHDSSLGLLIAYRAALDFAIMKQRMFAFHDSRQSGNLVAFLST